VLVVGLILLLVLTLAGVVLARMQTVEERMARNEDNHQLALQAAEATLRAAETGLNTGAFQTFASNNGIYVLVPTNGSEADALDASNWSPPAFPTLSYTAAPLNSPPLPTVTRQPQYVIEALPPVAVAGGPLTPCGTYGATCSAIFRITAHAWGGDSSATATVQSVFR
jgi:Tfp pilus assembly protein PilX